jgi:hypothetical protein
MAWGFAYRGGLGMGTAGFGVFLGSARDSYLGCVRQGAMKD